MSVWMVVGLGNPGPTYSFTRHNVGFMVADELGRRASASWQAPKGMSAEVAETRLGSSGLGIPAADAERLILVKPRTFMNDSGRAVGRLAGFHHVPADHVVVVHDELDLDAGRMRVKFGGGDNGHNGLKSLRQHLGTGDYYRVRFGIGRPPGRMQPADYVLARISETERADLGVEVARAADAVETLILHGLTEAQNRYNG